MISRIATFGHSTTMLAASLKVQAKLADQQAQTASGLKSTSYGGLGSNTGSLLRRSSQSSALTAENAAAQTATAYVNAAYSALGDIADLATTIKTQLASMISSTTIDSATTAQYATNWLNDLQALLNSTSGGTYLFSGTAGDTAAADFGDADWDASAGADADYYQGASSTRSFTTTDGQTIDLSVSGGSAAFEKLARALSMIIASPDDSSVVSAAYDLAGEALTGVGSLQEQVSIQASTLDRLIERNEAKIESIDTLASNLKDADLAQTAVLATQYETQLEAMYSMISTLSSLSLSKYL
ncbi:flagellar biosynthesis protein FlgL [Caulobacter flavus]|uniref:Flagellar biosynthesis protein FlgL n=1 Tax=Caulobacter flavus TaxID=1679497 RepID=A0A2N5CMD7_9CAUL|nr:flagellin [Caulobacter flavus]AYV44808.1 flagellar biosynthesis protein FlgL [Caulobacter flavus]PLR07148.1 flagellar biosynthesis protein FlgL [Caulobacter flavus]